ncbi:hypothetical protein TRIP_B50633 [uncultured Desulfatiglans sp.]|uniref:histidine kinase n=1 Tax=Uncultured Desulfatiglans sp. TaxID=1748965 RepID=A0A653AIG3_UNCDX|nr:hypothetical protein TRIP_B50633 [uncultured Desulfatiglans sp.]
MPFMKEDLSAPIIESMSDGLLVLNARGYIVHSNPAALETLNIQPEELFTKTYLELFMEEQENDAFNDMLFEGIQKRETRRYQEVLFRRRDGRLLDLAVTTSFLGVSDDSPGERCIVVVFKDITELKSLDRARKRVLAHLSHELKTPLSIILASFKRLIRPGDEKAADRVQRNLDRLLSIQMEVEDIVKGRPLPQSCSLSPWVDQALDLIELVAEENPEQRRALDLIRERIEHDFRFRTPAAGPVPISDILHKTVRLTREKAAARDVEIEEEIPGDALVAIDPLVIEKILTGILRNAVENTPDGGRIRVLLEIIPDAARISVTDTGTGITAESLKQIFGGFYHAKETELYSTRSPYLFGAGGKGLDLLRTKIYGEMFGFRIECQSTRCPYIPDERDLCPGAVDRCPHIADKASCFQSGGSTFTLTFPSVKSMPSSHPEADGSER